MGKKPGLDTAEKAMIATLTATGKTPYSIGKEIDRDIRTIQAALESEEVQTMVHETQERLGLKYQAVAEKILDSITDTDLEKASLQQKSISSATMLDKARLALGLTTENIGVRGVVIQTSCKELAGLIDGQ
jgi:hypothetical protein